jgi:hypothetical protein
MLDAVVVAVCAQCLAEAARNDGDEGNVALVATALARDLADTHGADALALLGAATRAAALRLDISELDADSAAAALRCLAGIRAGVSTKLSVGAPLSARARL